MSKTTAIRAALLAVLAALPAVAQEPPAPGDPAAEAAAFEAAFGALQAAVGGDDPQAVAGLARFPLPVTVRGREQAIAAPEEFVESYPLIVTPSIRAAVTGQRFAGLFVNCMGQRFLRGGQVQLDRVGQEVRVVAIGAPAVAALEATRTPAACARAATEAAAAPAAPAAEP